MVAWLLVVACHVEEPVVLVLHGPELVRVDQLGDVSAPEVMLDDGTEPRGVIWTASPEGVARIDGGQVEAVGAGEATVVAEWEEQTVQWTLVVELARVLLFVDPPAEVEVGAQVQLQVSARVGEVEAPAGDVHWNSSAPTLLAVSDAGAASGVAPGTAWVTATAGGAQAMVQIDVIE